MPSLAADPHPTDERRLECSTAAQTTVASARAGLRGCDLAHHSPHQLGLIVHIHWCGGEEGGWALVVRTLRLLRVSARRPCRSFACAESRRVRLQTLRMELTKSPLKDRHASKRRCHSEARARHKARLAWPETMTTRCTRHDS